MAILKSDLVKQALAKLAITGFDTEVNPEEIRAGVITLEELMAAWDASGIQIGYAFAPEAEAALAEAPSNVPDIARKAIINQLAIELAPQYGKEPSQLIYMSAASGMSSLLNAIAYIPEMNYGRRMPRGSGNTFRWTRWTRFYREPQTLASEGNGPIIVNGNQEIPV